MPKMQLLTCDIALAGDLTSIVHRGEDEPVSFPELLILQNLHGKESIRNVAQVREEDRDSATERQRLVSLYGNAVHQVFPAEYQELPVADFRIRVLPGGATDRPPEKDRQDEAQLGGYLRRPPQEIREEARWEASAQAPAGVKQPKTRPGAVKRMSADPDAKEKAKEDAPALTNEDGDEI